MKRIQEYTNERGDCGDCYEQGWIIEPDQPMSGRNVKNGKPMLTKYLRVTVTHMNDHPEDGSKPTIYDDTWVVGLDTFDEKDTNSVVVYTCQGALSLDEVLFTVLGTINQEDQNAHSVR